MKKLIFAIFGILFMPFAVFASVRVNEIAWMGTSVSSSNEWIELYNDGDDSVSLSGSTLFAEGTGKLSISLAGNIPAKSFFLLERTNDDTVPIIVADQIYTGGLGNSGEMLVLKDRQGTELQRIDASSGWAAGDNTAKETMQWNGGSWITAKATPKATNASVATPSRPSVDENKTALPETPSGGASPLSDTSAHSSPLPLSDFSEHQEFSLSAGRDRIVPAGGILLFEAHAADSRGKKLDGASLTWSFGDGTTANGSKVSHGYEYPGNYIVILNAATSDAQAVARANVRVFAPDAAVSLRGDAVSFFNHSPYEMNISGWKLRAGSQNYAFPEDTIVGAKEEILFSSAVTKFQADVLDGVALLSPNNKVVAQVAKENTLLSENIATSTKEAVLQTIQSALFRATADTEAIRQRLLNTTATKTSALVKAPRNTASYQDAAAIDVVKEASSTDEVSQIITLKKPEGFFSKLWHFFF
jgi:hypothetical protein